MEKFASWPWCSMEMCSILLPCEKAEDTSAEVMLPPLLSSSCWQWHPQSSRNLLPLTPNVASGLSCLAQEQQESLSSTLAVRAGSGWAAGGKAAVFALGWQRAVCLLACSTGTSVAGEAQLARQRFSVIVLLSWALIHKSPLALQGRHP